MDKDSSSPPNGGTRAWLVILGASLNLFTSLGFFNAFGVFQDSLKATYLSSYSDSDISWIGGLQIFVLFFSGLFVGHLFDSFGPRHLIAVGGPLTSLSMMMASISTEYWHFAMSLGVTFGVGAAMIFYPSLSIASHYFTTKRGLATGLTVAGSGFGGVIFPILVSKAIANHNLGFAWGLRICGFVSLFCSSIAFVLVRPRLPRKPMGSIIDMNALRDANYVVFVSSCFLIVLGMFVGFFYVSVFATEHGSSKQMSYYAIAILNAGSIFGRTVPGLLSDYVGKINTLTAMAYASGILTLAIWLPSTGIAPLLVFCVLYGFTTGGVITLIAPNIAHLSPSLGVVGRRIGMCFGVLSVAGLTGPAIAGAILRRKSGWHGAIGFSGATMLAGSIMLTFLRFKLNRRLSGVV